MGETLFFFRLIYGFSDSFLVYRILLDIKLGQI
jgi:hypothetical protein